MALNQEQVDARVRVGIEHILGENIVGQLQKFETQFNESTQVLAQVKQDHEQTKQRCDEILARMQAEAATFTGQTTQKMQEFDVQGNRLREVATRTHDEMETMRAAIDGSKTEIIGTMRLELQRLEGTSNLQQQDLQDLAARTRTWPPYSKHRPPENPRRS